LIGTIQPDVLQDIFMSKGSSNDGFMQRLQLAVWPDPMKQEYIDEPPIKTQMILRGIFLQSYTVLKTRYCAFPLKPRRFSQIGIKTVLKK
jgi:hypothetical protein